MKENILHMVMRFNAVMLCLLIACSFAFAQDEGAKKTTENAEDEGELIVNADSMEMRVDEHVIDLLGNVLVEDSQMRLTAKKMTILLDKDNKLRNIEAVGSVVVRKLTSSESATGDSAFYDAGADKVTLKGNCVILQGKNTAKGNAVIYDRKEGTIKLQGATISIPLKKGGASPLDAFKNEEKKEEKK